MVSKPSVLYASPDRPEAFHAFDIDAPFAPFAPAFLIVARTNSFAVILYFLRLVDRFDRFFFADFLPCFLPAFTRFRFLESVAVIPSEARPSSISAIAASWAWRSDRNWAVT